MNLTDERLQYLELLSQKFPSPAQVSTEIINLNAILGLPKGTEHFISDIHGEYRLFLHILKNASGSVRRKIFQCFSEEEMSTAEMDELATLIYYPEEKLALLKEAHGSLNQVWYTTTLLHLVQVCRKATSKYTRSKVRKAMPHDFAYIIDELLNYSEADEDDNRTTYVHAASSKLGAPMLLSSLFRSSFSMRSLINCTLSAMCLTVAMAPTRSWIP